MATNKPKAASNPPSVNAGKKDPGIAGATSNGMPPIPEDDQPPAGAAEKAMLNAAVTKPPAGTMGAANPPKAPAAPVKAKAPEVKTKTRAALPSKAKADMLAALQKESDEMVNFDEYIFTGEGNRYDIPPHLIPEGWDVEWKNTHVIGKPVEASEHRRNETGGWRPAPVELFAEMVPEGYEGANIERDGMILMMRPMKITKRFRDMELIKAKTPYEDKMREIHATPEGQMDRVVKMQNQTIASRIPIAED